MDCRCVDCGVAFKAEQDRDLCPACQDHEDRVYANRPDRDDDANTRPWPWSRAAMRERLGVTGDVDE